MADYFERISHPALTDIAIDWGGMTRDRDVYPAQLPDLFVGRPVVVTGRYTRRPRRGHREGARQARRRAAQIALDVNAGATTPGTPALRSLWARCKIADLGDRATYEPQNPPTLLAATSSRSRSSTG